jgi:hypothetical protein
VSPEEHTESTLMAEGIAVPYSGVRMSKREDAIVMESLQEFAQLQTFRNTTGAHWEEVAELIAPEWRNTFYYGSYNFPGQKKTDRQVDATGMVALQRFTAILDSLMTPRNMTWHQLATNNPYLNKDRSVKLWFEVVNRILFKERYAPNANFSSQNSAHWQQLGAFGNGCMYIDSYQGLDRTRGLRYKELPMGEVYFRENHQAQIDGACRFFRLTPQQAVGQFGSENISAQLLEKAAKDIQYPSDFLHRIVPRTDYDPQKLNSKNMPFASYYIELQARKLVREGGYTTFPIAASRYVQTPGEVYGRSPAMMVLPALKTLNAEKKDFLTQGHRAGSPTYLMTDDGVVDFTARPGSFNKGGMSEDGKLLVGILPTGEIQVTKEMMDDERGLIDGIFLVDLFKVLLGDPKIFTATQIVEMMSQRGILIAPTVGRQQSEYLGPTIDRELDVLSAQRMIPPMPPALREANGEYHVTYASPLAREMRAQEIAGFQRTLELMTTVAQVTQDPGPLDRFDFDTAARDIAEIQNVPESWMASDEAIAQKRKNRADAQAQQQQVQALPAQAAMLKARAAVAKNGAAPEANAPANPGNAQGQG